MCLCEQNRIIIKFSCWNWFSFQYSCKWQKCLEWQVMNLIFCFPHSLLHLPSTTTWIRVRKKKRTVSLTINDNFWMCLCVSAWRYHMQSFHLNTKNCYRLMRYDFVLDMCDFGNWSLSTLIFFHPKTHTLKPIYQTTPIFTEAFSKVCVSMCYNSMNELLTFYTKLCKRKWNGEEKKKKYLKFPIVKCFIVAPLPIIKNKCSMIISKRIFLFISSHTVT